LSKHEPAINIIGLWALLGLGSIAASVAVAVIADRLAHRRRLVTLSQAFEQAITLPLSYHAKNGSGSVITTVQRGSDELFWLWLSFLREQLTALIGLLLLIPVAISMNWQMASILGMLAVCYTGLNIFVMSKTSGGQARVDKYHINVWSRVGDVIGNVTIVQSYGRLVTEANALRNMINQVLDVQYPLLTWWGILTVLQRAASTLAMIAIFAVGALLASRGELSVGEIVSFVAFANLLIGKLDQLSAFAVRTLQAAPKISALFELLDQKSAIVDKPDARDLKDVAGHVVFDDVSIRFTGSPQGVFDLSFEARPGQTIALVGPTGAGKTTALALLQRLRDPDSGQIRIDGNDISDVTLASLRHSIGVVFQDAGLFNRSIAENIRIGRPEATDEEVQHAARLAEAEQFIMTKPGGYDYVIGERGASLSGGERQRLAIARAILKNAPILVLDEATSALDATTENRIKRAVDTLRAGRTTFIIAHRLSTVTDADEILVLDHGRIVERGTYGELLNKKGMFAQMVAAGGFSVPQLEAA
jgi:ATP-binding cassette subfamily B protein